MADESQNDGQKRIGPRQRRTRFIKEFLLDRNATRAAIAAGYSENGAEVTGHRLLRDTKIASQIDKENERINSSLEISIERVRKELARLAFYDPRKFFKPDGSLVPIDELDDDTAMVLAGMDVNELFAGTGEERQAVGYSKKVKLADKLEALEKLGRHLKMFTDKVEVTGSVTLVDRMRKARERVK